MIHFVGELRRELKIELRIEWLLGLKILLLAVPVGWVNAIHLRQANLTADLIFLLKYRLTWRYNQSKIKPKINQKGMLIWILINLRLTNWNTNLFIVSIGQNLPMKPNGLELKHQCYQIRHLFWNWIWVN